MADLYFEGSVVTMFAAMKTAGTYATQGQYLDVHCGDAAIEATGQAHALLRDHDDMPQPVGAAECPDDPAICGEHLLALCDQYEAESVAATSTEAAPVGNAFVISLVVQALPYLAKLAAPHIRKLFGL